MAALGRSFSLNLNKHLKMRSQHWVAAKRTKSTIGETNAHLDEHPHIYKRWEDGYTVRSMRTEDAKIVQKWYSAMASISTHDLDTILSLWPRCPGFYIGEIDGQVVSTISYVQCSDNAICHSLYYVDDSFRGRGLGKRLKDDVGISHVNDCILIGDGVLDEAKRWPSKGFKFSFMTKRFDTIVDSNLGCEPVYEGSVIQASDVPFESLVDFDNKYYCQANFDLRRQFLKKWIAIPGGKSLIATDNQNRIMGLVCRRPCFVDGEHMIGPLYAEDPTTARALLQAVCCDIKEAKVTINVWEPNTAMLSILDEFKFNLVFDLERHHLNGNPNDFKPQVFAVTSIDVMSF